MKAKQLLFTISSFGILTGVSQAALIASYLDGTGSFANHATTIPDVTVSSLTYVTSSTQTQHFAFRTAFGVPTPAGPTAGSAAGSSWYFSRQAALGTTLDNSNNYYNFTVTATGTNTLDLGTLVFDLVGAIQNNVNVVYDSLAQVFVNVDNGGLTSIGSQFSSTVINPNDASASHYFGSVTTASVDLSSITGATSVEFRISVAGSTIADNRGTFVQGIQLAPIPEPSTALLGGLGLLALLRRRR